MYHTPSVQAPGPYVHGGSIYNTMGSPLQPALQVEGSGAPPMAWGGGGAAPWYTGPPSTGFDPHPGMPQGYGVPPGYVMLQVDAGEVREPSQHTMTPDDSIGMGAREQLNVPNRVGGESQWRERSRRVQLHAQSDGADSTSRPTDSVMPHRRVNAERLQQILRIHDAMQCADTRRRDQALSDLASLASS